MVALGDLRDRGVALGDDGLLPGGQLLLAGEGGLVLGGELVPLGGGGGEFLFERRGVRLALD